MYYEVLYIDLSISEDVDFDAKTPIPGLMVLSVLQNTHSRINMKMLLW